MEMWEIKIFEFLGEWTMESVWSFEVVSKLYFCKSCIPPNQTKEIRKQLSLCFIIIIIILKNLCFIIIIIISNL